ncbi:aromatic-ring-hydroxylating dioxygenase subunit beta [Sphingopyxis sp. J-6]|uniref:aromatic-ring-hydroxylating dioxygenase subunit beta n=1 Tax=unclassified Sphingopyxis TaxID=2614943 RepID=UPI0039841AB7
MSRVAVDPECYLAVEQFLYREARLLDERDFEGWLGILAPDIHYWAPNRVNRIVSAKPGDRDVAHELSPVGDPAIYDETFEDLRLRIARTTTAKQLWCENPPSRVRHMISNIEAYVADEADEELDVYSNFVVYQARFDEAGTTFFGARIDRLRKVNGNLMIAKRKIILDLTVIPTGAVTVFF